MLPQIDFKIFNILYRLNYSDFTSFSSYNVIIVLSMHFNWFFSTKAYFKVCIKVKIIRPPFLSISIPTIKY